MDIDIDLPTTFVPQKFFVVTSASMLQQGELLKHPCGVYFQKIPIDPITGLAAIPYEPAEELGYFKIDFLHLSVLDYFENKNEIKTLLKTEPDWTLLQDPTAVSKLFQLHKHADLLLQVKPQSIQEIADCIALIRPSKKHLIGSYMRNKEETRKELYARPTTPNAMWFKKPHAVAYAMTITLQLHLIKGNII